MSSRYALRDRSILKWVMQHPGTGAPFSIRSLAQASGCGKGVIEGLLSGHQRTASKDDAHSIVEAVGVALLVLFAPSPSPERDDPSTKTNHLGGEVSEVPPA